jgi:hypothetical protein
MASRKQTEAQLAEKDMVDTLRTVVRLKHRIQMRHELNDLEAEALKAQQEALATGKPFKLDIRKALESGAEDGD